MIFIALFLVTFPVLVMIFFAIHKSLLFFTGKSDKDEPHSNFTTVLEANGVRISIDSDDEEMIAVISAAVSQCIK